LSLLVNVLQAKNNSPAMFAYIHEEKIIFTAG